MARQTVRPRSNRHAPLGLLPRPTLGVRSRHLRHPVTGEPVACRDRTCSPAHTRSLFSSFLVFERVVGRPEVTCERARPVKA